MSDEYYHRKEDFLTHPQSLCGKIHVDFVDFDGDDITCPECFKEQGNRQEIFSFTVTDLANWYGSDDEGKFSDLSLTQQSAYMRLVRKSILSSLRSESLDTAYNWALEDGVFEEGRPSVDEGLIFGDESGIDIKYSIHRALNAPIGSNRYNLELTLMNCEVAVDSWNSGEEPMTLEGFQDYVKVLKDFIRNSGLDDMLSKYFPEYLEGIQDKAFEDELIRKTY